MLRAARGSEGRERLPLEGGDWSEREAVTSVADLRLAGAALFISSRARLFATKVRLMFLRAARFGAADEKTRTVPVTLSTEYEVDRGQYREILSHRPGDIDLSRAPFPFIESHDTRRLNVGIVEDLRVENSELKGIVRFGRSARADEMLRDVLDRVVRHVSVGYELLDDGTQTHSGALRFRWRPVELSAVSVPADPHAQFFRSRRTDMPMHDDDTPQDRDDDQRSTRSQRRAAARTDELREVGELAERDRIRGIEQLCRQNKIDDATRRQWIDSGASMEAIAPQILQILEERGRTNPQPASQLGLTTRETNEFSVLRALRAMVEGKPRDAGLEFEASEELKRKLGKTDRQGLFVPFEIQRRAIEHPAGRRDLTVANANAAGYLVATDNVGFIEMLRYRSVVFTMGARRLSGLVGNVTVPKQTGAATAYWVAEGGSITESGQTFSQLPLTPKTCGALTDITRKLLLQSSPAAESIVMADLAQVVALGVDKAALHGSGAGAEPLGIANTGGIGAVAGATIDYAKVLEFQTDVADASVVPAAGGYATTSAIAKTLMLRQRFTSTDTPLWVGNVWDGQMAGFRSMASPQIEAATLFFGDWSELVIGEWSVLELLANPFDSNGFPAGTVRIRAMYDVDIGVRRPGAFSVGTSVS